MTTKLYINCKKHSKQLAVVVFGGEVWCSKCEKEFVEKNKNFLGD